MQKLLIVVLGKRLVNNQLTLESRSRVEGLIEFLQSLNNANKKIVLGFCGGVTHGNQSSEAEEMHKYFRSASLGVRLPVISETLVENNSTSTVENMQMLSSILNESGVFKSNEDVQLVLVSNDYHLERIFEIQELIDEQGLLRELQKRCLVEGITLSVPYCISKHVAVRYPYTQGHINGNAKLFLQVERLTTYRVFLEGVDANSIVRPLKEVQKAPLSIALSALEQARSLATHGNQVIVLPVLDLIEQAIIETEKSLAPNIVREVLGILDVNLNMLNRMLDPELVYDKRWWKR
ncbi:YdcF family protein [Vibrio penaeicida]|uniref:YdcF family protein n=1 Tax=Vibrio penaeicida TaxID=104609 RepID=UPI000CEA4AF8|nr:YdcF family protein [Vibrio penaeicida]